jgi:TonB family protein
VSPVDPRRTRRHRRHLRRGPAPDQDGQPALPSGSAVPADHGVVRLLVLVDEHGKVEDAEVIESIPVLDEAALRCVRKWRFEPGTRNGEPVPVYVVAPISFTGTTNVFGFTS